MRRLLRGVLSLLVILVVLVGAPIGLLRVGQLGALTRVDWAHLLTTPDTGVLLMGLLTVCGWLAWASFTASVALETAALVVGRPRAVRLPVLSWAQPVAAALVMGVAGLFAVAQPVAVAQDVAVVRPVQDQAGLAPSVSTSAGLLASPDATPPESSDGALAQAAGQQVVRHTVEPGDDLWTLAETHYGDGTQWRTIARANGLHVDSVLLPGMVLELPGARVVPSPGQEAQSEPQVDAGVEGQTGGQVRVRAGDSLSSIAEQALGDADRWPEIARANQDLVSDPNVIKPGWLLTLPGAQAEAEQTAGKTPQHQQAGEIGWQGSEDAPSTPSPEAPTRDREPSAGSRPTGPAERATTPPAETPPAPAETSAPRPSAQEPAPAETEAAADVDHAREVVGPIGGLLAMALVGALAARRRNQLAVRAPGRRIMHPGVDAQRFETALESLASRQPCPDETFAPCTVVVGMDEHEEPVLLDLERAGTTVVSGSAEDALASLAAVLTSLLCADWSAETKVVLSGPDLGWTVGLDTPQLALTETVDGGIVQLERAAAARRIALGRASLAGLRERPETAEAWAGQVHLFTTPPTPEQWERVRTALRHDSLAPDGVGMCVIAPGCPDQLEEAGEVLVLDEAPESATLLTGGQVFVPQMIQRPARRALMELVTTTASLETTPAPWWSGQQPPASLRLIEEPLSTPDEEEFVKVDNPPHPTLLLLGPVELVGARGPAPTRAKGQCIEYCAWIHANPGRTAPTMNRELMVADSTRRSNLSRLRAWLGSTPDGAPYLPEAYSGRIALDPVISTDWEDLGLLVSAGVDRATTEALVHALKMVRGAPLADAAPGSWHWAEEMRTDMVSTIRDIGLVLGTRALESGDTTMARWAASRALKAAPEDELLMCLRIRTEHLAGNRADVERLVLHLTRSARILGVDLAPETVDLLQEVTEGRRRAESA